MGERGSSFLNEKHVSAGALWPFPYTVHNPNRRPAPPEFHQRHILPLTQSFSFFFFFLNDDEGGKSKTNEEERLWGGRGLIQRLNAPPPHTHTRRHVSSSCVAESWNLPVPTCSPFRSIPAVSFFFLNRKINVKPRGAIVWTSNQELSLLSLPWH